MSGQLSFGVDFGSRNTAVAFSDKRGNERCKTYPSILNVSTDPVSIGSMRDPSTDSIINMKRVIGSSYSKADSEGLLSELKYRHISRNDEDEITFTIANEERSLMQCVGSYLKLVIDQIKSHAAEMYRDCTQCCITYPASFFSNEVDAIKAAFKAADLDVIFSVSEPVAAAVHALSAPGSDLVLGEGDYMFTLDMGGGTLDLTIMQKCLKGVVNVTSACRMLKTQESIYVSCHVGTGQGYTVISSGGVIRLGGLDIDQKIVDLLKQKAEDMKSSGLDWIKDPSNSADLLATAEALKIELSHKLVAQAQMGTAFVEVRREEMNAACKPVFDRIEKACRDRLMHADLQPEAIKALSMIGGASQLPEVKEILLRVFPHFTERPGQILNKDVATAVAQGALKIVMAGSSETIAVDDCTPLEFGVSTMHYRRIDDKFQQVDLAIESGKKLPVVDAVISAHVPKAAVFIAVPVYEGKDIRADGSPASENNSLIGTVKILNNGRYKPQELLQILLSVSVEREITVKVIMANGDQHKGVLQRRGEQTEAELLTDKTAVLDMTTGNPLAGLLELANIPATQVQQQSDVATASSSEPDDGAAQQTGRKRIGSKEDSAKPKKKRMTEAELLKL